MVIAAGTYRAKVGSQEIDLPLIPITGDLAIALLITVDHGVASSSRLPPNLRCCWSLTRSTWWSRSRRWVSHSR